MKDDNIQCAIGVFSNSWKKRRDLAITKDEMGLPNTASRLKCLGSGSFQTTSGLNRCLVWRKLCEHHLSQASNLSLQHKHSR